MRICTYPSETCHNLASPTDIWCREHLRPRYRIYGRAILAVDRGEANADIADCLYIIREGDFYRYGIVHPGSRKGVPIDFERQLRSRMSAHKSSNPIVPIIIWRCLAFPGEDLEAHVRYLVRDYRIPGRPRASFFTKIPGNLRRWMNKHGEYVEDDR